MGDSKRVLTSRVSQADETFPQAESFSFNDAFGQFVSIGSIVSGMPSSPLSSGVFDNFSNGENVGEMASSSSQNQLCLTDELLFPFDPD